MSLETVWFLLIAILWGGYFLLEGFDFGVGMLLPFLPRDERDRETMFDSIGPVWDGNEVWLVVAGAATFAAFPTWYATSCSSSSASSCAWSHSSGARRARARAGVPCGNGRIRWGASAPRSSGASRSRTCFRGCR
jgi:hypothetical protein